MRAGEEPSNRAPIPAFGEIVARIVLGYEPDVRAQLEHLRAEVAGDATETGWG
jgi:hypothetical protein